MAAPLSTLRDKSARSRTEPGQTSVGGIGRAHRSAR